jgi:hypothetical protein
MKKKYKADIVFLFNTKEIKNKRKIDKLMSKFSDNMVAIYGVAGIIWGFGSHYNKEYKKALSTYYVVFSNYELKLNEMKFYSEQIHVKIINEFNLQIKSKLKK